MTEGRFRRMRILGLIIASENAWKDCYHRGYQAGSSKRYRDEKKAVPLPVPAVPPVPPDEEDDDLLPLLTDP